MYLRTFLIVTVLSLLAIFALFNWSAITAPTTLTVGFTTFEAPPGLILLMIVGLITLLFLVYVVWLQSSALLEGRRQARELQSQRELADHAEESRFQQLRSVMEAQLDELENQINGSKTAVLARLDEVERSLRSTVEQSSNTLAAYIGEIEDRFERTQGGQK